MSSSRQEALVEELLRLTKSKLFPPSIAAQIREKGETLSFTGNVECCQQWGDSPTALKVNVAKSSGQSLGDILSPFHVSLEPSAVIGGDLLTTWMEGGGGPLPLELWWQSAKVMGCQRKRLLEDGEDKEEEDIPKDVGNGEAGDGAQAETIPEFRNRREAIYRAHVVQRCYFDLQERECLGATFDAPTPNFLGEASEGAKKRNKGGQIARETRSTTTGGHPTVTQHHHHHHQDQVFQYVESRYFYCKAYATTVSKTDGYQLLSKLRNATNVDLLLCGPDGHPVWQHVPDAKEEEEDRSQNRVSEALYRAYCDPSAQFGHERVLLCMLLNHEPWEWYRERNSETVAYPEWISGLK